MARYTVDAVIADIDAHYKKMAEITSEDITGENPGSMPGSENDQPAPADAKKPDPEVVDDQVGGAANYDGKGMEAGSDNPKLEPQLLEANEPVLTPEKKPLDSTDVDAKTASDLGNDLVSMVLNHQKKPEVKKAEAKKVEAKKVEAKKVEAKKAEDCKDKDGADVPAENKPAPAPAPEKKPLDSDNADAKEAAFDEVELSRDGLAKIAAVLMTREDGREFIGKVLAEIGGEKFAEESINALGVKSAEAMAKAEFEKGAQDAAALLDGAEEAQGAADAEAALGDAAEAQGAADAEAALGDAAEAAGAADAEAALGEGDTVDDFTDEEIEAAVSDMIESGELPPEVIEELMAEGDEGDVTEDDLAAELIDMVESGEITPEQASDLVDALETEADPEAAAALGEDVSAAAPEGDAGAADQGSAEQMVAEAEAKAAAVKKAAARDLARRLIAANKAIKEAKAKKAPAKK